VNDHTVPYPSAAIETVDHFAEFKDRNFVVQTDEAGILQMWHAPEATNPSKWYHSVGTLPPVLRFRFPYNLVG
jgi:hypothetical protein